MRTRTSKHPFWQMIDAFLLRELGDPVELIPPTPSLPPPPIQQSQSNGRLNRMCLRCQYFYGYRHGENLLMCVPHPYGPVDKNFCPDFQIDPDCVAAQRKFIADS